MCNKCFEWIPCSSEYFYINNKNKVDGLYPYCKKCAVKKAAEYVNNNRDKHNANNLRYSKTKKGKENNRKISEKRRKLGYHKSWARTERGKEKLKGYRLKREVKDHDITISEWDSCRLYFDYRCAYCGMSYEEHYLKTKQDLNMEHLVCGGRNDLKNCIPSCKWCNSSKHVASLNNWYNTDNEKYDRERYLKIYYWIRYDCLKFVEPKADKKKETVNENHF